jgi:hypothetical protein
VTIPEGTITAKVVQEFRNYATGPPLRQYIQEKNHWTDRTMGAIDWSAHKNALTSVLSQRVHFTKLVHEDLPTLQKLNKFHKGDRKCPGCLTAEETRDHIIRCSYGARSHWRIKFMAKLDEFHKTENTSPILRHVWREAMELAEKERDIQLSPVLFPRAVRQVIINQNAIGWRQIFNGRFALEWARVQDEYVAAQPSSGNSKSRRRQGGIQWQQRFILEIWKQWQLLWKSRNELLHGKTVRAQHDATRRQKKLEIYFRSSRPTRFGTTT